MTGALTLAAWRDTRTALGNVSGSVTFNLALGASFSLTMTGNVTSVTFSGTPPAGSDGGIVVRMTNGGAYTWTWPTGTRWAGGSAPTFTASGLDIVCFLVAPSETPIGCLSAKDVK